MMRYMAAKSCRIKDYEVKSGCSYFFDNNVWMLLFAGIAGTHKDRQKKYSDLLKDIKNRDGSIFISSLILSEYINRSLRLSFNQWIDIEGRIKSETDFKRDYRGTQHYKDSLKVTLLEVNDILEMSERRPDDFNSINIDSIFYEMSSDSDFNDSYYVELCDKNNMILVTDDTDLLNTQRNISIVTY